MRDDGEAACLSIRSSPSGVWVCVRTWVSGAGPATRVYGIVPTMPKKDASKPSINVETALKSLRRSGYCLWVGAGVDQYLFGQSTMGWAALTKKLESEAIEELESKSKLESKAKLEAGLSKEKGDFPSRISHIEEAIGRVWIVKKLN